MVNIVLIKMSDTIAELLPKDVHSNYLKKCMLKIDPTSSSQTADIINNEKTLKPTTINIVTSS